MMSGRWGWYERMDEILPHLYLGSQEASDRPERADITHVLTLRECSHPSPPPGDGVSRLRIEIDDDEDEDIARHFEPSATWIHAALSAGPQHRVLVHCQAGVSRSPTIIAYYLMRHHGMTWRSALGHIGGYRGINPNAGFLRQLRFAFLRRLLPFLKPADADDPEANCASHCFLIVCAFLDESSATPVVSTETHPATERPAPESPPTCDGRASWIDYFEDAASSVSSSSSSSTPARGEWESLPIAEEIGDSNSSEPRGTPWGHRVWYNPLGDGDFHGPNLCSACGRKAVGEEHPDEHMTLVRPNLYVGAAWNANNLVELLYFGVRSVVSMAAELGGKRFADAVEHKHFPLEDDGRELAFRPIVDALVYLERRKHVPVLIHCQMGISRSVTVAAAAVMLSERVGAREAVERIRRWRPQARPNRSLFRYLRLVEILLQYLPLCALPVIDDLLPGAFP